MRAFLKACGLAAALCAVTAVSAQAPNLLVIVADDLGVDYVGAYREGTNPPPTPNIDALARRGVLFRNAWAFPSCSPARASLLTGRYPFRTTVGRWIRHLNNSGPAIGTLNADEWTLPELLDRSAKGYAHACVGKWHIHDVTHGPDAPRRLGKFGHFAGLLEGQIPSYTRWTRVVDGSSQLTTRYCTTQNTDDALAFVGRQTGPWFLFLTYQAPHIPYHAPPSHLHTQNLSGLTPRPGHTPLNRPFYRAMVESLDTEIGRLLRGIGAARLANTNVLFVGDNGSVQQQAVAPFNPNRAKGTPYEGGINVPLIAAGPAVVSGNREVRALTCAVDVFATTLDLCGARAALPPHVVHDSVSLVPYLRSPTQAPLRQYAFSEEFTGTTWPAPNQNGHAMIRNDRYKLIRRMTRADELYDLVADPFETVNLLSRSLTPIEQHNLAALLNEYGRLRTPPARFTVYGPSRCPGSAGIPTIGSTGTPALNSRYSIELGNAPPRTPVALLVGASMRTWNGAPLPLDLRLLGAAAGCEIAASGEIFVMGTSTAAGTAAVPIQVPYQLSLVGRSVYHAWLVVDPAAPGNPAGLVSTRSAVSTAGY